MAWEFRTDPEFQDKLNWVDAFMKEQVEPLDVRYHTRPYHGAYDPPPAEIADQIARLKAEVRQRGLWACHLEPELGGGGYGQVNLALLHEILGRSPWGPVVFGCQAPDSGNAEIIARYGTSEQRERFLKPLLDGDIFSAYSMTEPQGGSDPRSFRTRARRQGDGWILDGEKLFTSNAKNAALLVVMAVTDPDVDALSGMSMFLVPADTPGVHILRNIGTIGQPLGQGIHAWVRYEGVRLPADALLGSEGDGFRVAQARLGGGRIHHAMRTVARCKKAFDMMSRRVISRQSGAGTLAEREIVQAMLSDSWIELTQLRLLVLYTAWLIDQTSASRARKEIAACKVQAARVLHDIVYRSIQLHGAMGASNELPLAELWMDVPAMGLMDGATPLHQVTIAKEISREYGPTDEAFPPEWLPRLIDSGLDLDDAGEPILP